MIDNSPEEIRIRKSRTILANIGRGIIAFSIWSAVKVVGAIVLRYPEIRQEAAMISESSEGLLSAAEATMMIVVILAVSLLIDVLLRLFIGMKARAEGLGGKGGRLYIILTAVLIIAGVMSTVSIAVLYLDSLLNGTPAETASGDVSLASLVIEVTSLVMLIELLVNARRVRQHDRREA